jgi:hypothetical protein
MSAAHHAAQLLRPDELAVKPGVRFVVNADVEVDTPVPEVGRTLLPLTGESKRDSGRRSSGRSWRVTGRWYFSSVTFCRLSRTPTPSTTESNPTDPEAAIGRPGRMRRAALARVRAPAPG